MAALQVVVARDSVALPATIRRSAVFWAASFACAICDGGAGRCGGRDQEMFRRLVQILCKVILSIFPVETDWASISPRRADLPAEGKRPHRPRCQLFGETLQRMTLAGIGQSAWATTISSPPAAWGSAGRRSRAREEEMHAVFLNFVVLRLKGARCGRHPAGCSPSNRLPLRANSAAGTFSQLPSCDR